MLKVDSSKYLACIFSLFLMLAVFSPMHGAVAQTADDDSEEVIEPCSPDEVQINLQTEGDIAYVTGGVGRCEAQEMRRIAKDYQLELVFVRKTSWSESFLAGIPLQITNSKREVVLDTQTDGPYLLANLPDGRYSITAEYNGVTKTENVLVQKKHQRIVFVWRVNT